MLVNSPLTSSVTPLISLNKSVLFSSSHLLWPELEAICWTEAVPNKTSIVPVRPLLKAQ